MSGQDKYWDTLSTILDKVIRRADEFLKTPSEDTDTDKTVDAGDVELILDTEAPTQAPTPESTQAPTQAPTPDLTPRDNIPTSDTSVSKGPVTIVDITKPSTVNYQPISVAEYIQQSNSLLSTLGKLKTIVLPNPSTVSYQPISVAEYIQQSNSLLSTLGKLKTIVLPKPPPVIYQPLSLANYIQRSNDILTNILKNKTLPPTSLIQTERYRNFITKLIADTSSAFDKYYPDAIKISEPQEWREDEKRLQYLGSKDNQMPQSEASNTETKELPKTYSVSIQKMGDDMYVPTSVLDKPVQVVGGSGNPNCNASFMNTMVNQADKLIKQIMRGYPMVFRRPRFSGGKRNSGMFDTFYDAPVIKPRSYNASDDIKQLFNGADTQLIFKREAPVKYDGNEVDEKATPENQRKIDLDELKINVTEGTANREEAEKEYELSIEKASPEKLQELLANAAVTDESKKALEKILGLAKPQIMCTDPFSCMLYTADSFAREIFRPTVITK